MKKILPGTLNRAAVLLKRPEMRLAIVEAARKHNLAPHPELAFSNDRLLAHLEKKHTTAEDEAFFSDRLITEAIILDVGRPALLVKDGVIEKAALPEVESMLQTVRAKLVKPIGSVGRIELLDHDTYAWCGTGWRVDDDHIITNRHVASIFARRQGNTFKFRLNQSGKLVRANIDFREEYKGAESAEFQIAEILWMAPDTDDAPDMAILRVKKAEDLPPPLELAAKDAVPDTQIGIVGYPAKDSRNDANVMADIFRNIYDVKRFSPGEVVTGDADKWYLTHDASTLGGNSGSCVLDLNSQKVLGLHFGGRFRTTNYAVKMSVIKGILARRSWVPVTHTELKIETEGFTEKKRTVASMADRMGYVEDFLGEKVGLPKPGKSHTVLKTGFEGEALPYTHFSILMSKSRRFPIVTAETIDGALKIKLKRKDSWGFDPRIPKASQVGHAEFYGPQPFDKGHMVRRENPGWGTTKAEAQLGEDDSFVYTNAIPQMPQLNQQTWLSLENYVLDNAKTEGFKICVFTGPIFRDDDIAYGDTQVQVPADFWKVIVSLEAETGELLTSCYLLSQDGLMPKEGFRFGPFRTYQVPITRIESGGDLKFPKAVRDADVFGQDDTNEMVSTGRFVEIIQPEDIVLTRKRMK